MNKWTTHLGLSPEGQEEHLRLIKSQKMQDTGWHVCRYLFTIIIINLQDTKLMKVFVGWLTPKESLGSCEVGSTHQNLNTGCPQRLRFGCKTPNSTEGRKEGTPQDLSQDPDISAQRHLAVPEEFVPGHHSFSQGHWESSIAPYIYHTAISFLSVYTRENQSACGDFPGGSVVNDLPASAEDMRFNPWSGKLPHTLGNSARVPPLLKPRSPRTHTPQQEKSPHWEALAPQWRGATRSPQLEKARVQ